MSKKFSVVLFFVLTLFLSKGANSQEISPEEYVETPKYLLLDRGLQYRITKAINSMYDFDFPTAERDFTVIMYQYPDHPLPDFLMALGYWWRIEIDVTNTRFDNIFIQYLDRANAKAAQLRNEDRSGKGVSIDDQSAGSLQIFECGAHVGGGIQVCCV